jgi:hypothetical protein
VYSTAVRHLNTHHPKFRITKQLCLGCFPKHFVYCPFPAILDFDVLLNMENTEEVGAVGEVVFDYLCKPFLAVGEDS